MISPGFLQRVGNLLGGCVLIFFFLFTTLTTAHGQQPGWSQPELIMATEGRVASSSMKLVADKTGRLHLFYPHILPGDNGHTLDYMRWTEENGWSLPVDIVADSIVLFPRTVIDSTGRIHLIYLSHNRELKYSSAHLSEADQPQRWTRPQTIVRVWGDSDLLLLPDDNLIIAYPDVETGQISLVRSNDNGQTWGAAIEIASVSQDNTVLDHVRIAVDGNGSLHAVWTEYELPNGWPPIGVYYAHTNSETGSYWQPPVQICAPSYAQIGLFTNNQEDIHLVWRSTIGGDGTFHQFSPDGGQTWSIPDQFTDRGGVSGMPSFAADSLSNVHYVIGRGSYAFWSNNRLSDYQSPFGPLFAQATESVERAALAITHGNRVHLVVEVDFKSIWHTTQLLDTPRIVTDYDYPVVEPIILPEPTLLHLTADATEPASFNTFNDTPSLQSRSAYDNLLFAVAPPIFLVLLVILFNWQHKRRAR